MRLLPISQNLSPKSCLVEARERTLAASEQLPAPEKVPEYEADQA